MNKAELLKEIERLNSEIEQLSEVAIDATERIKVANDMVENYQRMFDEIFQLIKTKYDAEFTVEDMPKLLS